MKKLKFFQWSDKPKKAGKMRLLLNYALLAFLLFTLVSNQFLISTISSSLGMSSDFKLFSGLVMGATSLKLEGELISDSIKLVIPTGVPEIYGEELGISFDSVQQAINVTKVFDPTYGKQKFDLNQEEMQRYIDVGLRISCEYCCSAKSIIKSNGDGACGCAHSQAMRGLLSYLVKNHGDDYTNDELLRELARWKGTYFPKQMIQKISSQLQGGEEFTPDTAALILDIKLPDYGSGKSAPLPSEIKDLPSMVGGC